MRLAMVAVASLALAGCLGSDAPAPEEAPPEDPPASPPRAGVTETLFEGSLTATPATPASAEHAFEVPENATSLVVLLGWDSVVSELTFRLVSPDGADFPLPFALTPTDRHLRLDDPVPGTWTVVVSSERALAEPYAVIVRTATGDAPGNLLVGKAPVEPRLFYEINLEMSAGNAFVFSWRAIEDAELYFNVHTHRDGEVTNYHEGSYRELSGNFTATDDGGASLLWANQEFPLPVTVTFRVEGEFSMHSVFP